MPCSKEQNEYQGVPLSLYIHIYTCMYESRRERVVSLLSSVVFDDNDDDDDASEIPLADERSMICSKFR